MERLRRRTPLPEGVLDAMTDRRGRLVYLREGQWEHIVDGHRAMDGLELAVKAAVESADTRERATKPGREILYGRNLGPAKWLAVVVAYPDGGPGIIITAYPQTKDPPEQE